MHNDHTSSFSPAFIQALQTRPLTEADYEILLRLDQQTTPHATPTHATGSPRSMSRVNQHPERAEVRRVNPLLCVEPLDSSHALLLGGASCGMCHKPYVRGDWVKTLLCKHEVRPSEL